MSGGVEVIQSVLSVSHQAVRAKREKRFRNVQLIIDLCYLAGLEPAGLLCELVNPDDESGSMARRDDCWRFAKEWGLTIISVEDLAQWVEEKGVDLVPNA